MKPRIDMVKCCTIAIALVLPLAGCVVKTIDVRPGVPLRITHPTVTNSPDVRQGGKWIPSSGNVTIEPGEEVFVPLAPTTESSD
ncbi:MAG: hypothetical protein JO353_13010 [Phycisphaerae bacterium]|nr:hypothetical protein [Phycisphaerae bacterium]